MNGQDQSSKVSEKHPFRKVISRDQCFGCKLVSVPFFFAFSGHMANKNYTLTREFLDKGGKIKFIDKFGMVCIPLILFIGGSVNLYSAMRLFSNYTKERQIWLLLA